MIPDRHKTLLYNSWLSDHNVPEIQATIPNACVSTGGHMESSKDIIIFPRALSGARILWAKATEKLHIQGLGSGDMNV